MNELISREQPGQIAIDNFQEFRQNLTEVLLPYQNISYTPEMLADAKADKKYLSKIRREIDDRRKEVKRAYLVPLNEFEAQVKDLIAMVDGPLQAIKEFVDGEEAKEKEARHAEIERYYYGKSACLGDLAQKVWDSPAFFESKWLNKTESVKNWKTAIDSKIAAAAQVLQMIRSTGGSQVPALTARYLENLDATGIADYSTRLAEISNAAGVSSAPEQIEDRRSGYKIIKITGNVSQILHAIELLDIAGVDYEELEDGIPSSMREITTPDFDSYVAFDIETTGTFGAASGDLPAEITEIGAVKVENGEMTARFDQLVNPGRAIVPQISRITGITDAMVADAPGIETVIRAFADFTGNSILVGHNIKSSDLYYIDRAAKRAGVTIENSFFDTYRFAKTLRSQFGWEKVTLPYLSNYFGIEQNNAHRAWCDAEANAGVYQKLRELAG